MKRVVLGGAVVALGVAAAAAAWLARAAPQPTNALHTAWATHIGDAETRVHRFHVDLTHVELEIADLGFSVQLADALADADLVINGGYWAWYGEARRAQGLLAERGRELAPLDAKLGGGVLVVRDGRASLEPPDAAAAAGQPDLALQCSPRLVVAGKAIPKLNDKARAARTVLCVRDAGHSLDAYLTEPGMPGPTLKEIASWLVEQGCEAALNLDGGPSTAAAWREGDRVTRLGPGTELPYALRFRLQRAPR